MTQKLLRTAVLLLLTVLALTARAQQTWWGLWNSGQGLSGQITLDEKRYDLYVRLTAQNSPLLVGGQLSGLRFWLWDKEAVASVSAWLSATYKDGSTPTVMRQEIPIASLLDYMHDQQPTTIDFTDSYAILPAGNPYGSIYVGISIELKAGATTRLVTGTTPGMANSCYATGLDLSAYGALALQVKGGSPLLPAYGAEAQAFSEQTLVANSDSVFSLRIKTVGYMPIASIDYTVGLDDGGTAESRHYDLPKATDELGLDVTVPMRLVVPSAPQRHSLNVSVTQVNGQPVAAADTATSRLIVIDRPATRRTVMEEFTGTWCLNCVRGFAGIGLLQAQHGDRFIPIAVHGDERDPMVTGDYYRSQFFAAKMKVLKGYPSCTIDRLYDCDPYCGFKTTGVFATGDIVETALARPAVAEIGVEASWNADLTAVNSRIDTRFGYATDADVYRLVIAVTADGLRGETSSWNQRNGYNDYQGTEEALLAYAGKGDPMKNMTYDHVAIAIDGCDGGLPNSITLPIEAGVTQQYQHQTDLSANPLVQDKQRLRVVAMLVDGRDGTVVNAAAAPVTMPSSGIEEVQAQPSAPRGSNYYNLAGQRLRQPVKGLSIVAGKKVLKTN